jgi:hypothetical protein
MRRAAGGQWWQPDATQIAWPRVYLAAGIVYISNPTLAGIAAITSLGWLMAPIILIVTFHWHTSYWHPFFYLPLHLCTLASVALMCLRVAPEDALLKSWGGALVGVLLGIIPSRQLDLCRGKRRCAPAVLDPSRHLGCGTFRPYWFVRVCGLRPTTVQRPAFALSIF